MIALFLPEKEASLTNSRQSLCSGNTEILVLIPFTEFTYHSKEIDAFLSWICYVLYVHHPSNLSDVSITQSQIRKFVSKTNDYSKFALTC